MLDVVGFAQHVYKSLREREQSISDALANGSPKNWEQYQSLVGEIRGLAFAREELKALLEKTSEDAVEAISS